MFTRILASLLLFSYAGIAVGSFTHGLLHHLNEKEHRHSLPCLVASMAEIPGDEEVSASPVAVIEAGDCEFKLALHEASRPIVSSGTGFVLGGPWFPEALKIYRPVYISLKKTKPSSFSSRGPPGSISISV
jgi:hypothetical protein